MVSENRVAILRGYYREREGLLELLSFLGLLKGAEKSQKNSLNLNHQICVAFPNLNHQIYVDILNSNHQICVDFYCFYHRIYVILQRINKFKNMYRKAYRKMMEWKDSKARKPLLLLGARQVGKTWLMKEFGRREYENVVYINCDTDPLAQQLFLSDYDIPRIILGFQAISGETITEGKTLIILDEIQEAKRGIHSLKYFCENASGYHIMAAGSLLGVALAHKESFPVGKVDMLHIYPMDFEEFLLGIGQKSLSDILTIHDQSLIATFSGKLTDYLFQYYYVGGMPEAVLSFAQHNDLNRVREIQRAIIDAYRRDTVKHTSKTEAVRIDQVIGSLPSQLAKENKKFIFGAVRKGARAADFELAIQWLQDAGLIYKATRVSKIAMPLKFYEEYTSFKLFFVDTGLLGCMAEVPSSIIIDKGESLKEFKGMLTEQYVAQQLASAGFALYYWTNDSTPAEIDFAIQKDGKVYPIEVKASTNIRGKSIAQYMKKNPEITGLRFSLLDFKEQDRITNIPLYEIPYRF